MLIVVTENPDEEVTQMTEQVTARRRGSYGIDAPFAPAFMAVLAALEVALAVISGRVWPLLAALFILAMTGSGVPAGIVSPYQLITWNDGRPDSPTVGSSGSAA